MPKIKFTPAEKIEAVERYLSGQGSQPSIAKSLGIYQGSFQQWIRNYESIGADAFTATVNKKYSAELKTAAVRDYLAGTGSQDDICKKYGLRSRSKLQKWIKWSWRFQATE